MLKLLRKKGVMKKMIWFVAVIIILSFGVFGTAYLIADNNTSSAGTYAGKIFGKRVSFEEYQKSFQDVRVQNIIRYGDKYNEVRPYLNFEKEAWDRLIVLKEADRLGIKVKNDEVISTIQNYAFFQRNGQFDTPLYNDVVRFVFEMKPRSFEESIRDTIKASKLVNESTKEVSVTEDEVYDVFQKQNEKVQISYLLFTPDDFKDQSSATDEEIQAYYEENKLEFLQPFSINVEFIALDLIEETEEDNSVNDAVLEKANKIYQDAAVSGDLTAAAKTHGLETKLSGFFSREEPNLDLKWSFDVYNQVFQLSQGELLAPVRSSNSIIIAKIAESREAYVPEFTQAADKVKDKILRLNARGVTKEKAEQTLASIEQAYSKKADFTEAADTFGYETQQTPEFNRGQYLPKIGISPAFQEAAFRLSDTNKISGVIEAETGYYILHLDSYISADAAQYVETKDQLTQQILAQKRTDAFGKHLASLREKADLEDLISRQRQEQQ